MWRNIGIVVLGFSQLITGCVAAGCYFGGMAMGGTAGAIVSMPALAFLCLVLGLELSIREAKLSGDPGDPRTYQYNSEQQLLKIILLEYLRKKRASGMRPVAKKSLVGRLLLTAAAAVLLGLCINLCYHALLVGVLAVAYTVLFVKLSTVAVLCRAVKKEPDEPITAVVDRETYDERETPRYALAVIAMVVLVAVSVSSVLVVRGTYKKYAEGMMLVSYRPGILPGEAAEQIRLPETVDGLPLVAIGDKAFLNNRKLETITIPDGVRHIGSYAFKGCSALKTITLPEKLETLGGEAFRDCGELTAVVIPEGVTEIRGNTFQDCCSLEQVTLHEGIVDIHAYAFQNCEMLEQLDLPSKITEIHTYTFDGCLLLREIKIPVGVTRIAAHAFSNCASLYEVYIPDTVTQIRSSAFRNCASLEIIELPKGVEVDERAFKDSPTRLVVKKISDKDWEDIQKEFEQKAGVDVLYCVTIEGAPDMILPSEAETVRIVDDSRFSQKLKEGYVLQELTDIQAVKAYLEKAQANGITRVEYVFYSKIASDRTGEVYFVTATGSVEDFMDLCEEKMAEAENAA